MITKHAINLTWVQKPIILSWLSDEMADKGGVAWGHKHRKPLFEFGLSIRRPP